jgi:hypothetical protein
MVLHKNDNSQYFDVFLSHSHTDASWVEQLAHRLENEAGLRVWLDRWVLITGKPWQQEMARGIDQAGSCAVCIGKDTPTGWFQREIERALNHQVQQPAFPVIPVLLPKARNTNVDNFLELNTWVDFRKPDQTAYAFHALVCGIKGQPPGPWPPQSRNRSI